MTQHQHVPAHWYESAMQSINEKDAEIERLSGIYEEALRKEGRDVAEIERLRAAMADIRDVLILTAEMVAIISPSLRSDAALKDQPAFCTSKRG